MSPSHPERVVRFIVEIRERDGATLLTDTTKLRGVVVDMIKIEDMDAAVTESVALVDRPISRASNATHEVLVQAFPPLPLRSQLDRLENYASMRKNV